MNIIKILIKSKNLGSIYNYKINQQNFINFNQSYYNNLISYNFNVSNVSFFYDFNKDNYVSEFELHFDEKENDLISKIKLYDSFSIFKHKHYKENLYLKVNYLRKETHEINLFSNKKNNDVFLL